MRASDSKHRRSSLLALYDQLDPQLHAAAVGAGTTCTRGCSACCRMPVWCTLHEAAPIARAVLDSKDWRARATSLAEQSKLACRIFDPREWFARKIPCALLDNGECSVYAVRPSVCRYYYVASPPAQCGIIGATTAQINPDKGSAIVATFIAKHAKTRPVALPLPTAVLVSMKILERRQRRRRHLEVCAEHIPPQSWWDTVDKSKFKSSPRAHKLKMLEEARRCLA